MDKMKRITDISEIANHLSQALIILNSNRNTRELSITRTDLQKLLAFYMFHVFPAETGISFTVESTK